MATKSSKIAVTLQPDLKQKLREYGKENQIKNFSGVILAILDDYFGGKQVSGTDAPTNLEQVLASLEALSNRVAVLEGDPATNTSSTPKPILKSKTAETGTAKPSRKSREKAAAKTSTASKNGRKPATRKPKTSTTSKSSSAAKSSSKSAPIKKATSSRKSAPTRSTKSKDKPKTTAKSTSAKTGQWMSTREAFEMFGESLSWSRFSKLTPEELKERFNLDSDLSRKVRGSRFNQWLKLGK